MVKLTNNLCLKRLNEIITNYRFVKLKNRSFLGTITVGIKNLSSMFLSIKIMPGQRIEVI
jgi:hypothetical protein